MYSVSKIILQYLRPLSFYISIFLFLKWIYQMKSNKHLKKLELKSMNEYIQEEIKIEDFNRDNPNFKIKNNAGWLKFYRYYLKRRYDTLFLSLVFSYISFNTESFYQTTNENFFKLLGISTTLFLAICQYIQVKRK